MSAVVQASRRRGGTVGRWLASFGTAVSAVATKELRGRMRGRRAFVVVTIYLVLLSVFAFGIYLYLKSQAGNLPSGPLFGGPGREPFPFPGATTPAAAGLSASIGHGLFGGLLMIETLLVLVLAPAFTTGAISLEREKQTLDMLVTTPLSTLGMVVGKLLSALTYVFLLIIASIPLASLVFVFGGVGPDDLVRGYVVLFALAFGMGAIGLFASALVRRTQTATVLTYIVVLALTIGSVAVHEFLVVATQGTSRGTIIVTQRHRAPEALLWMNPFVAGLDLVCVTAPGTYHESCAYMSRVTGKPYFGTNSGVGIDVPFVGPGFRGDDSGEFGRGVADSPPVVADQFGATTISLGFPRDTFWPKSAAAFGGVGLVLTLLSAQLVAPTRRLRFHRPVRRSSTTPAGASAVDEAPAAAGPMENTP